MVWGSEERQVGLDTGKRIAALNPDVPIMVIDRARATPELELPAPTIATIEASIDGMRAVADARTTAGRVAL